MKKRKIQLSLVAVLLLFLTYGLGYRSGFSRGRSSVRVVVGRDSEDSKQSLGKTGYDPYFAKQNAIPDKVK